MKERNRALAPWLIAGFLTGAALLAAGDWTAQARWLNARRRESFGPLAPRLARGVLAPASARARRLFWLIDCDDLGAGIDLLGDAAAFDSVFPGYDAARGDEGLWRRYFSLPFDSRIVSPELTAPRQPQVMTSWTGALEIHRRYGADVLLFGSSEVFNALFPAALAKAARSATVPSPKVLSLTVGNMSAEAVTLAAGAAAETGRRAAAAVWGYSLWNAYRSPHRAAHREILMASWAARTPRSIRDRVRELKRPDWNDLLPFSFQLAWDARKASTHADTTISLSSAPTEAETSAAAATLRPAISEFDGVSEADCRLEEAAKELDAALAALLAASDRVLLYIPPTTPLQTASLPPCYAPAVAKLLRSRAGPRVAVITDDWRAYGLGYGDYLKPSNRPGFVRIDPNHVAPSGARKVSEAVGSALTRVLARPPSP